MKVRGNYITTITTVNPQIDLIETAVDFEVQGHETAWVLSRVEPWRVKCRNTNVDPMDAIALRI